MSASTLPVYRGPWVDFSHGYIEGATLTLTTRDGAFLVSFLTLYITIAGSLAWAIVAYVYHQRRANAAKDDQDGLWNQEQAILRNTGSPIKVAIELLYEWQAWRKIKKRSLRRLLTGILLALATMAIFAVAGVFAGQVTKSASINVLIHSAGCGDWDIKNVTQSGNSIWETLVLQNTLADAEYARACYDSSRDSLTCGVYTNKTIHYSVNANATCPTQTGTCFFSNTAAYEMDTGLMDSNDALGLNSPKGERITYRKVTTCAPIHIGQDYGRGTIETGGGQFQDPVVYLYMGPMVADGVMLANYTYRYNEHSLVETNGYTLTLFSRPKRVAVPTRTNAVHRPVIHKADGSGSLWTPISELNRTDADVTLLILAQNSIDYNVPCDDPWFSAHQVRNDTSQTWYVGDDYFNILACADQHQFCNPKLDSSKGCTSLADEATVFNEMFRVGFSDLQIATAGRIAVPMVFSNMYYSVNGRGAAALRASETCFTNDQAALPNNQWQIEIDAWFATSLARLQQSMVDYAVGPTNAPAGVDIVYPTSLPDKAMCRAVKIRAPAGVQNFSLLGVLIILIVGTLLILVGIVIDKIGGLLQKCFRARPSGRLAWVLDEKLQLQRMAFEGAQWTGWQNCDKRVPTTAAEAILGRYGPLGDQHSGIVQPAAEMVSSNAAHEWPQPSPYSEAPSEFSSRPLLRPEARQVREGLGFE
ncbi:hypothetical protein LTR35_005406 [Friedmanniomyces endolithicus]|uniref:Uncharacterized protein n=1 Tax=Friedmanniomyces endolithicus TaxID=329885 RepID=A0AAN6FBA5_9PEZI|nr:hypothetical protein LTR35_005406 [Friedmanniomyces endolithicus]KAK0299392.1 hypothetical protein LTS00_001835 [Friedmanniomyces endolithicus]KAK0310923.1 hypothetical protein LTR82_014526 [Friedmanniomyces endolithicus]KAK0983416.1 hypothetical protein LTR54_014376 [Friedmanniomyces endolithicus]